MSASSSDSRDITKQGSRGPADTEGLQSAVNCGLAAGAARRAVLGLLNWGGRYLRNWRHQEQRGGCADVEDVASVARIFDEAAEFFRSPEVASCDDKARATADWATAELARLGFRVRAVTAEELREASASLCDDDALAVEHLRCGKSPETIAVGMGTDVTTVRACLVRAYRDIRINMQPRG
jgi:hypothetical protein